MNRKALTGILGALIIIIILALIVFGYDKNSSIDSRETIKIGIAVGLTGYAANWGEGETKAIELAYDKYKEKLPPIEFVTENTKSDGLGTVNAMTKLIEIDGVQAIIGPTWGDSFQGGYPIATRAKVAVITPSGAFESLEPGSRTSYMFSTWWPQAEEARTLIDDILSNGASKAVILHDLDAFNASFAQLFTDEASSTYPGKLTLQSVEVPIGTSDFRTHIAKIKSVNPGAVVVLLQDTSGVGPFMKQIKEQGLKVKVYSTTSAENEDNLKKFPGLFEGLRYSFPAFAGESAYTDLHSRFVAKYGPEASEGPAFVNSYNAAIALFEVISAGAHTGETIAAKLQKIRVEAIGVPALSFDDQGKIQNARFIIKEIQGGQFVQIN